MSKKKILMVYGAGASVKLGMTSMYDIDKFLEEKANSEFSLPSINKNLYSYIRDCINEKYPNFEKVLYVINQLSCIVSNIELSSGKISKNHNFSLNHFVENLTFPEIKNYDEIRAITGNDFRVMYLRLLDELLNEFRYKCINVDQKDKNFDLHSKFLNQLSENYELGIFTTNYDNLILQALPNLFTGFDRQSGEFLRRDVIKRQFWDFVYHVHGSVHFNMPSSSNKMHSIKWLENINKSDKNSFYRSGQTTTEGLEIPNTSIIVGYDKLNQIQKEPFRNFYSALDSFIYDADAIIFVGYGFGDNHINNPFLEIKTEKPNIPIIVIDYSSDFWKFTDNNYKRKATLIDILQPYGLEGIQIPKDNRIHYRDNDRFMLHLGGYPDAYNDLQLICDFIEKN